MRVEYIEWEIDKLGEIRELDVEVEIEEESIGEIKKKYVRNR